MINDEKFGLKPDDIQKIINVIHRYPQIYKAVIYGSRAKGNFKNGSDVDISIFCSEKDINFRITGELNEETLMPYHFDVVNYLSIKNEDLKKQIDKFGVVIYESNRLSENN
jgi:uncharacterized protein